MNYARVLDLRADLNGTGYNGNDQWLAGAIAEASRQIRTATGGRQFHPTVETRYFDGRGCAQLWVNDLLSITSLKFDEDGDRTYEETLATTDYYLWPDNRTPYRRIDIDPNGDYTAFPAGRRSVQIVGTWGYEDRKVALIGSAGVTATVANGTGLTFTCSEGVESLVSVGDTIVVESEDAGDVVSVSATDIVVRERGINGTTAAAHSAKQIYIRRYPEDVERAVRADAARYLWRMAQGLPSDGSFREMWPAIAMVANSYTDPASVI